MSYFDAAEVMRLSLNRQTINELADDSSVQGVNGCR